MVMGLVSRLSLANHSDSESFLLVHTLFSQDGCQREGFWEVVGQLVSVSFWPFRNSSGWWRLISSLFLTRTSCHKTTHANGYYGFWPGWAGFSLCASPNKRMLPSFFWACCCALLHSFIIWEENILFLDKQHKCTSIFSFSNFLDYLELAPNLSAWRHLFYIFDSSNSLRWTVINSIS